MRDRTLGLGRRYAGPVHISAILRDIQKRLEEDAIRMAEHDGQLALQLFYDGSPDIVGFESHQDQDEQEIS